jgi:hypothetical protein
MTIKEFITIEAPKRCGVHPAYGKVAGMVFDSEQIGEKSFSMGMFPTMRERCKLGLPFIPVDIHAYERCLNILEMVHIRHYEKRHGKTGEYDKRFSELEAETELTAEESKMVNMEWWNT